MLEKLKEKDLQIDAEKEKLKEMEQEIKLERSRLESVIEENVEIKNKLEESQLNCLQLFQLETQGVAEEVDELNNQIEELEDKVDTLSDENKALTVSQVRNHFNHFKVYCTGTRQGESRNYLIVTHD